MEHLLPFAHVQGQGALGTGSLLAQGNDLAAVAMAARGDFIGDIVHFEQCRLGLGFGDEGADALHAHQQAFGRQLAQGAVDGHAAEAQLTDQLAFRRHTIVWRPAAILDLQGDHLFDAGIQGRRTIAHLGNQRSNSRRSRHGNSFIRNLR
ncbi:hypothetical protein D9M71_715720 [compost metagenome]